MSLLTIASSGPATTRSSNIFRAGRMLSGSSRRPLRLALAPLVPAMCAENKVNGDMLGEGRAYPGGDDV